MISTDLTEATAASEAAGAAAEAPDSDRADWLDAIADRLETSAAGLVDIAMRETHLPHARLSGEVSRTTGQLRLFADVVRDGAYLEATLDDADPTATPPRPDLRRMLVPVGTVAVFSASNFPFAFSVAGGDSASALAVGCPVIVKAHSAHPALSDRTAELVSAALRDAGAPEGIFSLVHGRENGRRLVRSPAVKAVGFTGSLAGGKALLDLVNSRPDPIPFYGELSSINPVVVTPGAAAQRGEEIANGLVGSFTQGVGQFCTKPGVVFLPDGGLVERIAQLSRAVAGARMLAPHIASAYRSGLERMTAQGLLPVVRTDPTDGDGDWAAPALFTIRAVDADDLTEALFEECFGPVTVVVTYREIAEIHPLIARLQGSLTGTIHSQPDEDVTGLVGLFRSRMGRLVFNGWPTGVAVAWSQQHGGPWPATNSIHTSVGATAVRRFLRPVVYQDAPQSALPAALRTGNPLAIPRRVNGRSTLG